MISNSRLLESRLGGGGGPGAPTGPTPGGGIGPAAPSDNDADDMLGGGMEDEGANISPEDQKTITDAAESDPVIAAIGRALGLDIPQNDEGTKEESSLPEESSDNEGAQKTGGAP